MCSCASIYYPGVGVTGYEVFFKQGEFSMTLIHLSSSFTAERKDVGCPDLIPHQKVVSVSESLPMLIAGLCFSTCRLSMKGAIKSKTLKPVHSSLF